MQKIRAAFHNLGCKVNAYETEVMMQQLSDAGYEIVPFQEKAEIYIINTCTVTNIADRKSRQMLHKAKKMNPDAIVVAVGCYAQAAGEEAMKETGVDLVIGNNRKKEIVSILEEYRKEQNVTDNFIDINHTDEYEEMSLTKATDHTRAYIKIQDGCNQFCSYCIIPFARGRVRSRKIEQIVEEAESLAKIGYQEIVLTGIHISSYGIDFKEEKKNLLDVILAVHEVEGIKRIRLGSLEPRIITEEFAKTISRLEKVCPHFHLSLQSGCDETLKRMNRQYTTADFEQICIYLRKYFEHPALTTDVIVGFPGETEEEFLKTMEFLEKIHFAEMHVFKYSMRKGTRAAKMTPQVPDQIKAKRSDLCIALEEKMEHAYKSYWIGKETEVLFEEKITVDGQEYFVGHTREYLKVAVQTNEDLTNRIERVIVREELNKQIVLAELLNIY